MPICYPAFCPFVTAIVFLPIVDEQRELKRFKDDASVLVLLLSLRAGNVGLNLTCATRVFLLDPWWNPAVEEQALARVHRFGQQHPVVATRIIVKNTVVENILQLHEHKRRLCNAATADEVGTEGRPRGDELMNARRLRLEDLAMCFEPCASSSRRPLCLGHL